MTAPKVITKVATVAEAKEVRLMCPHCYSPIYVKQEWAPFADGGGSYASQKNQQKKREAIEEHRKLCSAAPPEAGRVYSIEYPRT